MDLNKFIKDTPQDQPDETARLSKEEYAALKKQEREELWGEIDAKAQEVFQDGKSLKGFLDFMAQCKPQRTANLLLLYSQNPEIRQVKTFDKWKEEKRTLKAGVHGYRFIAGQEYEKDGVMAQGYTITKAYDVSQIRMRQPEPPEPKPIEDLIGALLTDSGVNIQIADNLPENVQAQYVPRYRTVYVRNGMSEEVTFHAINRELACAALDMHDGNYNRTNVSPQAFCSTYVVAQKYGVDVTGFNLDRVCAMQENGNKDPKELRGFLHDVKNAAYSIESSIDRSFGEKEQEFKPDEFAISEGKQGKSGKGKTEKER